jgi:hypothetical protein
LVKYLFMHMYDRQILISKGKLGLKNKFAAVHNLSLEEVVNRLDNIHINA